MKLRYFAIFKVDLILSLNKPKHFDKFQLQYIKSFYIYKMSITFKPNTPQHIILLTDKLRDIYFKYSKQLFKCQRFKFHEPQLRQQQQSYMEIFPYIESWNDIIFYVPYDALHLRIEQIAPINFIHLQQIKMSQTEIYSIEALAWLNAPQLSFILISENNITSLKPLAKCNLPNLKFINIQLNKTNKNEFGHLTRMNLKRQVQILSVNQNDRWFIDINSTWISPAVKLPVDSISNIAIGVEENWNQIFHDKFSDRFQIDIMRRKDIYYHDDE